MPFGWKKQVNAEGKIIYVDETNNRSTFTDPRLAFALEEKEHPQDFRQKFDGSTPAMQILQGRDLSKKIAIVTGANCGIGKFDGNYSEIIILKTFTPFSVRLKII